MYKIISVAAELIAAAIEMCYKNISLKSNFLILVAEDTSIFVRVVLYLLQLKQRGSGLSFSELYHHTFLSLSFLSPLNLSHIVSNNLFSA